MNILNLRFELSNPWDRWEKFKNLGYIAGVLFWHKAWEIQHTFYTGMIVEIDFRWTCKQDHSGLEINLGIFGYSICVKIYDTRHWNYETNKWKVYNAGN